MRATRIVAAIAALLLILTPTMGSTHPAGPAVCTGTAPADSGCTTGNDHFITATELSTLLFIYPQFGNFKGRLKGILKGIGNGADVSFQCDYTGDAATDIVEDSAGAACQTLTSNYPDPGDQFSFRCVTSAYGKDTGKAEGTFFCGVNHT